MRKKLIYVEVFDRVDKPTLTGRLVYPIAEMNLSYSGKNNLWSIQKKKILEVSFRRGINDICNSWNT